MSVKRRDLIRYLEKNGFYLPIAFAPNFAFVSITNSLSPIISVDLSTN